MLAQNLHMIPQVLGNIVYFLFWVKANLFFHIQ